MTNFQERKFPAEGKLIAKLGSLDAETSRAPYRPCIRFFGVVPESYVQEEFNSELGCDVFVVEVPWDLNPTPAITGPLFNLNPRDASIQRRFWETRQMWPGFFDHDWFEISYRIVVASNEDGAIGYTAFEDDAPVLLQVNGLRLMHGPAVKPAPAKSPDSLFLKSAGPDPFELFAFHVGQGMCSLLTNSKCGVIFDAGAAKPVHRDDYRLNKRPNELREKIDDIKGGELALFLSHDDYDHWCLIEWDTALRQKIDAIFVPDGVAKLEFRSRTIVHKVFQTNNSSFTLDPDVQVDLYRTHPTYKHNEPNSKALVAVVDIAGRNALLPGDYVYAGMAMDKNAALSDLVITYFDAVVVPHHGEVASQYLIPKPKMKGSSIAFFSAGTHARYRHPRPEAITAHKEMQYKVVSRNRLKKILALKLL